MNEIKYIVACDADGSINGDNIFAYKNIFADVDFIETIRESFGIMPAKMYNKNLTMGMLVCKDISSSLDNNILVSMVKAMEGRDVGRVCIFLDEELFECFYKSGLISSYICIYPENTQANQKFHSSYNVLYSDVYNGLSVDTRVCTSAWDDADVDSAISDLEAMVNDAPGTTEPSAIDKMTDELRNDAKFENFVQNLESSNVERDDDDIELSAEDIANISQNDSQSHLVQDSYASLDMVQKLATLLNQTVVTLNQTSTQVNSIIGLLNRHMEQNNSMFNTVDKVVDELEKKVLDQIESTKTSVKGVRQQLSNVVRRSRWFNIIPIVLSAIALGISIYGII